MSNQVIHSPTLDSAHCTTAWLCGSGWEELGNLSVLGLTATIATSAVLPTAYRDAAHQQKGG